MSDLLPLERLKVQLRLDPGETGEDDYLRTLVTVALRTVEHQTGHQLLGGMTNSLGEHDQAVAVQAAAMLVGTWYANRESVTAGTMVQELPHGVRLLLAPLRNWRA